MTKTRLILLMLVMTCALLPACGDNNPAAPPSQPSPYKDLTTKENVLSNIETAYNRRSIARYDELLDDNFTFYLYPGDVGGEIPASWDRATEVLYNMRLFDKSYPTNTCKSISMDLQFDPNNISWVDLVPDQSKYPGETWKTAVIYYAFRFDVLPDTQYESAAGARAQFTVRNVGTDQAPQWRLVEMDDLSNGSLLNYAGAMRTTTQASTWGQVKALYRR